MKLGFFSKILGDVIDLMPDELSDEENNSNKYIDVDSDVRLNDDD